MDAWSDPSKVRAHIPQRDSPDGQFPDYHFAQSSRSYINLSGKISQNYSIDQTTSLRRTLGTDRWDVGGSGLQSERSRNIARQFLLGRTLFREHFGKAAESPVLWLPDVFGYAWALPQLIRQAGLKYFMTIKIGWNQYNRLPYDTFMWQGIDGTQILTHFTRSRFRRRSSTYNSMANTKEALGTWQKLPAEGIAKGVAHGVRFGEAGEAPREMLENIEVMKQFPALPQVRQSSAKQFLKPSTGDRIKYDACLEWRAVPRISPWNIHYPSGNKNR